MLLSGVLHYTNQTGVRKITTFLQVLFLAIAIANVVSVSSSIENKQGLSSINKIVAWTISSNVINLIFPRIAFLMLKTFVFFLVLSMFLIRKTSKILSNKTSVLLSIGVPYIQLSLNMEVLFMIVLLITLSCWRKIMIQSKNSSHTLLAQWRHAFFFVSKAHISTYQYS